MSSVLRFFKQTPSNTLFASEPTKFWLASSIETYADGSGAVFTSPTVITFPSMTALQGCLNALYDNIDLTSSNQSAIRDMGKRIYMGVEGEESEMVVFALAQAIQGTGADQDFVGYVCVQDVTNTLDVDAGRGAW